MSACTLNCYTLQAADCHLPVTIKPWILQETSTTLATWLSRSVSWSTSDNRLCNLAAQCLIRDKHECAISGAFDCVEARKRIHDAKTRGIVPLDDSGNFLYERTPNQFNCLYTASILPHFVQPMHYEQNGEERFHRPRVWHI